MAGVIVTEPTYTIADGLDVVVLNPNEVLVQFGTRSLPAELLRDPNHRGVLGSIISEFLSGPRKISDVFRLIRIGSEQAEFEPLIADLVARGILADVSSNPIEQYLTYTFTGISSLRSKRINVVGAGPIGARVARSLVQHGVGKITLLDDRFADDHWEMYQPFGSLGRAWANTKNTYAHHRLRELLGGTSVEVDAIDKGFSIEALRAAIDSADLTIAAFEQRSLRVAHLINRICLANDRPWIIGSGDGNLGTIGPLFIGRDTGCYNCYEALSDSAVTSRHMARRYRKHVLERGAGSFFAGLPAFADVIAGYLTLASVHYLLEIPNFLAGRIMNINFDRMIINIEDVLKLPRCPVCGDDMPIRHPAFPLEVVKPP
jgi:bacteriocin biosynthesis cyclodehydratase domain-containing protein